jgi:hypothetical protein
LFVRLETNSLDDPGLFLLSPGATSLKRVKLYQGFSHLPLAYGGVLAEHELASPGHYYIERAGRVLLDMSNRMDSDFAISYRRDIVTLHLYGSDTEKQVDKALDLKTGGLRPISENCNVRDRRGDKWYLTCKTEVSKTAYQSSIEALKPDGSMKELVPSADGPAEPGSSSNGEWVNASASPDGSRILAQWSGKCQSNQAFLVPASGGQPAGMDKVLHMDGIESFAIGWTKDDRAIVAVPGSSVCSDSIKEPGIYLIDKNRIATLLYRLPTLVKVAMWRPLD